jgi:hypothetical protein
MFCETDNISRSIPGYSPHSNYYYNIREYYVKYIVRAGPNYAQVERRSVIFLDQTMSTGEAFGLKKYTKIIHY